MDNSKLSWILIINNLVPFPALFLIYFSTYTVQQFFLQDSSSLSFFAGVVLPALSKSSALGFLQKFSRKRCRAGESNPGLPDSNFPEFCRRNPDLARFILSPFSKTNSSCLPKYLAHDTFNWREYRQKVQTNNFFWLFRNTIFPRNSVPFRASEWPLPRNSEFRRNEHFFPRNNGIRSEAIPRNIFRDEISLPTLHWAYAEMFKSQISRPNRIQFSKISCSRPLGP